RTPPDAGRIPRASRSAMRLLHARHGDERARPGEAQQETERAADPRMARRQSLPLHRLSQHRQGDQSRRRSDGEIGIGETRMYDFQYHKAKSVAEAASLVGKSSEGKLVAGG